MILKATALTIVSIPLLLIGLVASTGVLVVEVDSSDGPDLTIPVPLVLARAAIGFAPEQAQRIDLDGHEKHAAAALAILEELASAPDGVLVEVSDGREHVLIEKSGGYLDIEVDEGDDDFVSVSLPLDTVVELLEACEDGEIRTRDVLRALSSASSTELVHVQSDDEEVRVWIW